MELNDPQFWLNAHYIWKWDGPEAARSFLKQHGIVIAGHAGNAEYQLDNEFINAVRSTE